MRGINKLILNRATLIDAIQEYLDKRALDEIRQVRVTGIKSGGNFNDGTFEVCVEEAKPNPIAQQ